MPRRTTFVCPFRELKTFIAPFLPFRSLSPHLQVRSYPLFATPWDFLETCTYIHRPFLPSQETFMKITIHSSPLFATPGDFLETYCALIAPFCHLVRLSWNLLRIHRPFLPSQETFLKLTMPSSPLFVIPRDFLENWCTFVAPFCHFASNYKFIF